MDKWQTEVFSSVRQRCGRERQALTRIFEDSCSELHAQRRNKCTSWYDERAEQKRHHDEQPRQKARHSYETRIWKQWHFIVILCNVFLLLLHNTTESVSASNATSRNSQPAMYNCKTNYPTLYCADAACTIITVVPNKAPCGRCWPDLHNYYLRQQTALRALFAI